MSFNNEEFADKLKAAFPDLYLRSAESYDPQNKEKVFTADIVFQFNLKFLIDGTGTDTRVEEAVKLIKEKFADLAVFPAKKTKKK